MPPTQRRACRTGSRRHTRSQPSTAVRWRGSGQGNASREASAPTRSSDQRPSVLILATFPLIDPGITVANVYLNTATGVIIADRATSTPAATDLARAP